jgi:hypothetical protein
MDHVAGHGQREVDASMKQAAAGWPAGAIRSVQRVGSMSSVLLTLHRSEGVTADLPHRGQTARRELQKVRNVRGGRVPEPACGRAAFRVQTVRLRALRGAFEGGQKAVRDGGRGHTAERPNGRGAPEDARQAGARRRGAPLGQLAARSGPRGRDRAADLDPTGRAW